MTNPLAELAAIQALLKQALDRTAALGPQLQDGWAECGNAEYAIEEARTALADASVAVNQQLATLDALAAGEPWAVSEARTAAAQERADYLRRTA